MCMYMLHAACCTHTPCTQPTNTPAPPPAASRDTHSPPWLGHTRPRQSTAPCPQWAIDRPAAHRPYGAKRVSTWNPPQPAASPLLQSTALSPGQSTARAPRRAASASHRWRRTRPFLRCLPPDRRGMRAASMISCPAVSRAASATSRATTSSPANQCDRRRQAACNFAAAVSPSAAASGFGGGVCAGAVVAAAHLRLARACCA